MLPQLSTISSEVDATYTFILWVSVTVCIFLFTAVLYLSWKYRRRPGLRPSPPRHHIALEAAWTLAPLPLLAYLFHAGFADYLSSTVSPWNATQIHVEARQWAWDVTYPDGVSSLPNTLVIPEGQPVELVMSSHDVVHSFFIPAMRLKRDVVPGVITTMSLQAAMQTPDIECTQHSDCPLGTHCGQRMQVPAGLTFRESLRLSDKLVGPDYDSERRRYCAATIFCAEYCGAATGSSDHRNSNHSSMLGDLYVVSQAEYEAYLRLQRLPGCGIGPPQCPKGENQVECWGGRLREQFSCSTCHSIDGSEGTGPTWLGLWGRARHFQDGSVVIADLDYIRESILHPQRHIVVGDYGNMPNFNLEEPQIEALAAYIESLGRIDR